MGRTSQTLLFLIAGVLLFAAPRMFAQADGIQGEVMNYTLPQSRGDGRLQFVVFGDHALYKGALIVLDDVKIDIVQDTVHSLKEANIFLPVRGEKIPGPYDLLSSEKKIAEFWAFPKQHTVRAWIFAEKAVFDNSAKILRSDEKAHFRSREIDVDGIGFDAYSDRKFIHIRSNVKAYIRPLIRKKMK